jgi:hypothetical protein
MAFPNRISEKVQPEDLIPGKIYLIEEKFISFNPHKSTIKFKGRFVKNFQSQLKGKSNIISTFNITESPKSSPESKTSNQRDFLGSRTRYYKSTEEDRQEQFVSRIITEKTKRSPNLLNTKSQRLEKKQRTETDNMEKEDKKGGRQRKTRKKRKAPKIVFL